MSVYDSSLVSRGRRPDAPLAAGLVPSARAERSNPLCGDDITVEIVLDHGTIQAAGYRLHGCAFVRASASLLAEQTLGLSTAQALALARQLAEAMQSLDRLPSGFAELNGVHLLPTRRRCALLPWEALVASLESVAA